MNWLALVPIVVQLIAFAEKLFGSGTGPLKKSMVMGATESVVTGMQTVSTGGQKETWNVLAPTIAMLVDSTVSLANAAGWVNIEDDSAKWGG